MMKTKRCVNTALMTLITIILSSSTILMSSEITNGWNYRLIVTIDNTDNPQNLTDYQVLVELDSNFSFPHAQPDGDDLRFTNQKGDILPHWIEFYDAASKKAKIWVKVDSIPASGTTSIIMYYGNPGALDTSDFDTTFTKDSVHEGLVALWHMDEGSGTTIADSSGNGNNGTFHADGSPAWVGSDGGRWDGITQQFSTGDSLNFDGIDYVNIISVADNIVNPDTVFVFWAKGNGSLFTVCKSNVYRDYFRIQIVDGHVHVTFRPANNYKWCIKTEEVYPLNEWVFIVLGHNGSEPYLYVNGILAAITFTNCFPGTLDNSYYIDDYGIPTRVDLGASRTNGNPYRYYTGEIDEVRIYERTLLPGEITALYERREYTTPEPIVRIEKRLISGTGNSHRVLFNQMLKPLAFFHLLQAESLKEETHLLLQEAIKKGLDISEYQPFIETADGLVENANKFYSSGNYIAANNLALQAINLYKQIIEILEDFLRE